MGFFNKKTAVTAKTTNLAGGAAYQQSPELALVSLLMTSFAQDQYYRKTEQTFEDLAKLLAKVDPEFAAKAGVFTRNAFGMRSITHMLAAELAPSASGAPWAKAFYDRIIKRPDDMLEIAAAFRGMGGKNLPNAMKKGFASAFKRFDGYQLAKYRGDGQAFKLVDLLNLVHPKATDRNAEAMRGLVSGDLKNTETWEAKLSQAGIQAQNDAEKAKLKAAAWAELLFSDKLGYLAMLRNLRNIAEQAPGLTSTLAQKLVNQEQIRKALILPFQFMVAMDAVKGAGLKQERQLLDALNNALDLSLANVPVFEGKTLVVIDDSGSMTTAAKGKGFGSRSCISLGAVFAAALFKSNDADLMRFSYNATYISASGRDSLSNIAEKIVRNADGGGTNFHAIFQKANKVYTRIIILSDMQGWMEFGTANGDLEQYKKRMNADPFVYSFDLAGYSSMQLPENKTFCLAGFSDKVFDIMKVLETDRNALLNKIREIEW